MGKPLIINHPPVFTRHGLELEAVPKGHSME